MVVGGVRMKNAARHRRLWLFLSLRAISRNRCESWFGMKSRMTFKRDVHFQRMKRPRVVSKEKLKTR